jgi:phosphoserine phosphatase RsbU/P
MRILIAEDDLVPRCLLQATLTGWGYEVIAVGDGTEAWHILQAHDAPKLAILDWEMPGLDGVQVCRQVRQLTVAEPAYLILLTGRNATQDIVTGLQNGANDYVTKPFDRAELQARIQVGQKVIELQHGLAERVRELEESLREVKQLRELLPICSYCKKVRHDQNYWEQVDHYLARLADFRFSHGICPDCWQSVVTPQLVQAGMRQPGQDDRD